MIDNIYIHRINTIEEIQKTPINFGVEIDLRCEGTDIILNHDPFMKGPKFETFLKYYSHNGLILNCKAEGMEQEILKLLEKFNISKFFFLDLSIPFLVKTYHSGCKKIAVRFSEYEPKEFIEKFKNKCDWVWVDSFTGNYFDEGDLKYLSKFFKICLVSPELRGFNINTIDALKFKYQNIKIDSVCTKNPQLWI